MPLYINKKSESLKLIQQARNEAHRFAITFHRDQRSKNFIDTELNNIPGIGEKTAQKLLTHFGSVKKVREALASELIEVLGMAKAKVVKAYFDKEGEVSFRTYQRLTPFSTSSLIAFIYVVTTPEDEIHEACFGYSRPQEESCLQYFPPTIPQTSRTFLPRSQAPHHEAIGPPLPCHCPGFASFGHGSTNPQRQF